jgi:hypothetical protein
VLPQIPLDAGGVYLVPSPLKHLDHDKVTDE